MTCKDGVCHMPAANESDKPSNTNHSTESCCGEALPSSESIRSPSKSPSPPYLTTDMDFAHLTNAPFPVFVRFTASWCKPCKAIEPLCSSLYAQYNAACDMVYVDVDEHEALMNAHKVLSIPTLLCFREGKEVGRVTGSNQNSVRDFVENIVKIK
eukprot:gene38266-46499_t